MGVGEHRIGVARRVDPAAPMLIGALGPGAELTQGRQKSLLAPPQLRLDL